MSDTYHRAPQPASAPPHWRWTRLSRVVQFKNGADYKEVESDESGYPVFGSGGQFRWSKQWLHDGPSVLFGRKGTIDRPIYVEGKFWTVDTMFYTIPNELVINPKFLYYWATRFPFGRYMSNTALPSMTQSDLGSEPLALPPLSEQRAIASYLDHETAEIDAFVRDQEDLIQLLNERRDAEIVSLLRRPTDPAQRLKFCLTRNEGGVWGTEPEDTQHSTIVLRSTEQTVDGNWRIKDPARRLLPAEEAISKKLRLNDLVVTKSSGSSLHIGKTTLVTKDVEELQACFGNFMQRLRVSPALNPQFLWMLMNSSDIRRQMDYLSNSTTGLSNLNSEVIGDLEIPRVSLQEQIARVARVNSKLAATNSAVSDALQANRLARERRSALISAAVTGQLEVTQRHRPVVEQLEDEVLERV